MADDKKPVNSEDMIRAARDQLAVGEASEQMVEAARKDVGQRGGIERAATDHDVSSVEAPPRVEQPAATEVGPDNLVTTVRDQARRSEEAAERRQTVLRPPPPVSPVPVGVATPSRSRRRIIPVIFGVIILFSLISRIFDEGSSDSSPEPTPIVVTTIAVQPPATTQATVPPGSTVGLLTVGTDTVLTSDHQGSITIVEDGVTLDCAGNAVLGESLAGTGIDIQGRTGVTVRNCEVRSFDIGIHLRNSSDVVLSANSPAQNRTGIRLVGSDGNRIADNIAERNIGGIVLDRSDDNTLESNTVADGQQGILIDGSNNNTLLGNAVFSMSNWFAFAFGSGAEGNQVLDNRAEDSGSGFAINLGANHNRFSGNEAVGNLVGFNVLDDPGTELNTFVGNTASDNEETGFRDDTRGQLGDRATENLYSANTCEGNTVASSPANLCE